MRLFKSHPLLKLVNSYVIDSPTPSNISYFWNFGSLLGFCLFTSPAKPHAFVSLPLQSGFSFNWSLFKTKLKEKCTIQNSLILFITTLLGYSLKLYVSNRWGVELNDFCVYMSAYGVIGGSVKLVKSFLEGFEFVKDSNTLKMSAMSANGGNIPTGVGGGNNAPQGPAGPANNPPQAQAGPANNPPQAQAGPLQGPAWANEQNVPGTNGPGGPDSILYGVIVTNPIQWQAGPGTLFTPGHEEYNQVAPIKSQNAYGRVLSAEMERNYNDRSHYSASMPDFDDRAKTFFATFIRDKFRVKLDDPNPSYYNTNQVRRALKKLR